MLAASRSDRVSRRLAARAASASSSWARSRRTSASAVRVAASAAVTASSRAAYAASLACSAARSTPRASPRRWRSTLWSAFARSSSSRCSARTALSSACSAATCAARRACSAWDCSSRSSCSPSEPATSATTDSQPSSLASQARAAVSTGSSAEAGTTATCTAACSRNAASSSAAQIAAPAEPGAARRREAGHLAEGRRHRSDRRQDRRHQCDHPQAQPLRKGRWVGHRRPVIRRPGRRTCPPRRDPRPRWRRCVRTSGRRPTRPPRNARVSSSTWCSPARSKCQYSVVRRVRVTSKRVRLPQPAQRHRSPSPGTRRSLVCSGTDVSSGRRLGPWWAGAVSVVRAPRPRCRIPRLASSDMSTTAHRPTAGEVPLGGAAQLRRAGAAAARPDLLRGRPRDDGWFRCCRVDDHGDRRGEGPGRRGAG